MIAMKATPGQEFSTTLSRRYVADDKGMIRDVHIADVSELLAAGASTATLPATVTLKAQPGQSLYFDGKTHAVGADGLIRDVPFDVAVIQIKAGVCVEATESDEVGETPAGDSRNTRRSPFRHAHRFSRRGSR